MKNRNVFFGLLVLSGLVVGAFTISSWSPNSQTGSKAQLNFEDTGELPSNSSVSDTDISNANVTVNGLTTGVQRVDLNPDWPTVTICADVPDVADWIPVFSATYNGKAISVAGWMLLDSDEAYAEQNRCFETQFWPEDFKDLSGELVLSLDYFTILLPEKIPADVIAAANELTKSDQIEFEYEFSHGGNFIITSKPASLSEEEALQIVNKALLSLQERVVGPWVFNINLE